MEESEVRSDEAAAAESPLNAVMESDQSERLRQKSTTEVESTASTLVEDNFTESEEEEEEIEEQNEEEEEVVEKNEAAWMLVAAKVQRDQNEMVDLWDMVLALEQTLVDAKLPVYELSKMQQILTAYCRILPETQNDRISLGELKGFLKRFGPLDCAFRKANQLLFTSQGALQRGFWGFMTKARSRRILSGKPPGTFLLRTSPNRDDRMIVTYVSRTTENEEGSKFAVHDCSILNAGRQGFVVKRKPYSLDNSLARATSSHPSSGRIPSGSTESRFYFNALDEFIDLVQPKLSRVLCCPAVELWNSNLKATGSLDRSFLLSQDIVPFGMEKLKGIDCDLDCRSVYNSPNVSLECRFCDLPRKHISALNPPLTEMEFKFTEPDQLDALLRKGAEKFRFGHRTDAEALFRQVLNRAEENVALHQYRQDNEENLATGDGTANFSNLRKSGSFIQKKSLEKPSRKTTGMGVTTETERPESVRHDVFTSWCKCITCMSLRAKARTLGNIGHIYSDKKQFPDAIAMYKSSLPILRELGMWKQEPIVLSSLTTCAQAANDAALGVVYGLEYYGTLTQEMDRRGIIQRLESIGALDGSNPPDHESIVNAIVMGDKAFSEGAPLRSLHFYGSALRDARCRCDDVLEVNALIRLGSIFFIMHRLRDAVVHFERVVLLLRNNNISASNRGAGKARVDLHNLALHFAKEATQKAGWQATAAAAK